MACLFGRDLTGLRIYPAADDEYEPGSSRLAVTVATAGPVHTVHISAGGSRNWQRGPGEFARRPSSVASGESSSSAIATYHPS